MAIFRNLPWHDQVVRDPGMPCGECGRPKKVYHRRLSSPMALGLIRLYRLHQTYRERKGFHVKLFDKEGARGEFGVLACWGIVDPVKLQGGKHATGMWALTQSGAAFVELRQSVPLYAMLRWQSQLLGFAGSAVTARECLESSGRWKYDDLIGWKPVLSQEDLTA